MAKLLGSGRLTHSSYHFTPKTPSISDCRVSIARPWEPQSRGTRYVVRSEEQPVVAAACRKSGDRIEIAAPDTAELTIEFVQCYFLLIGPVKDRITYTRRGENVAIGTFAKVVAGSDFPVKVFAKECLKFSLPVS